jgi:6-phosphogluconolactonase
VRTVPADSSVGNYPSAVLATEPSLRLVATYPCGGEFPRDMVLGDGGRLLYVANEHADSVTGLVVDPMDGGLAPADWAVTMPRPTCVLPV